MGRNTINLEDFKNAERPHSKLIYNVAKKNNLTIFDVANFLDCSYSFIVAVLKGTHNLSIDKANKIRQQYE
jgi:cyanate lyase|tara:strand:+ start:1411 stop:1623 length:213 start_codon:yes stop_codon:yes gene_type:complete